MLKLRLLKLKRLIRNVYIDISIQREFLGGIIESIDGHVNIHATESTGYEQINNIFFNQYSISAKDIIVDVGCGKARVFNFLLYKGIRNQMIGYEINPLVGNKARKKLARFKNVKIISENIFDDFPSQANLFYLFNPFSKDLMEIFKESIWNIRIENPTILYFNAKFINVFDDDRFIYEMKKIPFIERGWIIDLAIIRVKNSNK